MIAIRCGVLYAPAGKLSAVYIVGMDPIPFFDDDVVSVNASKLV